MEIDDRHRLERHARRIEDLRLWRNACEHRIEEWSFVAGSGKPRTMRLGEFWPVFGTPVFLSAEVEIPKEWEGAPVEIELWLGGEGFVRLSNGVTGGLNPFHRAFPVTDRARAQERVGVEAEVVSKGLWGSHVAEPRIERAALVVPETGVRALLRDLAVVETACKELDGQDVVPRLLDIMDAAFAALTAGWPSESGAAVARYLRGYEHPAGDGLSSLPAGISSQVAGGPPGMRAMWNLPEPDQSPALLPGAARLAVAKARKVVAARLDEIKREYPPVGRLALTGHAHIDLAWLWPLAETRRKARRTFSSILGLMDRYEDFTFNQSSAQLYAWVEEDDPEMFQRIKERVNEGRWEPVGGMWCEPDCQIPSGESFVRQLLHGQRYFEQKFGRRSAVAWLPDAFGFSPGIP
ncbi:MAG TPA: alpha-mannosidase, partial [Rubrobacteraceae bacterium]|nr:alpha-mannosidase [Rubrobacteraceae bacterium]